MAMYGQGATRGRVALLAIDATYNQACAAIAFGPSMVTSFGRYFFMAAYEFVRDLGNETSQMNLSSGAIRKFTITLPPIEEQKSIVAHLDARVVVLDNLLAKAQKMVTFLREHRSALISAAVTGKIDVRDQGATLVPGAITPMPA